MIKLNIKSKYGVRNVTAIAVAVLLTACSGGKVTSSPGYEIPGANTETLGGNSDRSINKSARDTIAQPDTEIRIQRETDSWTTLQVPVKIKMTSPKSVSCSGRLTMVRDTETTISMRMLGMEVACIHFDRDSIVIYEKLNHYMVVAPMEKIYNSTGLTVVDFQNMLIGSVSADQYLPLLSNLLDEVSVTNTEPVETPYGEYPSETEIYAAKGKFTLCLSIKTDYSKAKWDETVQKFKMPKSSSYTRLKMSDIVRIFNKE